MNTDERRALAKAQEKYPNHPDYVEREFRIFVAQRAQNNAKPEEILAEFTEFERSQNRLVSLEIGGV